MCGKNGQFTTEFRRKEQKPSNVTVGLRFNVRERELESGQASRDEHFLREISALSEFDTRLESCVTAEALREQALHAYLRRKSGLYGWHAVYPTQNADVVVLRSWLKSATSPHKYSL